MLATELPEVPPICVDATLIQRLDDDRAFFKITTVTNLLFANCAKLRAAVILLAEVNRLLPSTETFERDPLEYAMRCQESLRLEHPWRVIAARQAIMAMDSFRFLVELLATSPIEFGIPPAGPAAKGLQEIHEHFSDTFPDLRHMRNAVAHTDQIFREKGKHPFRSTVNTLNDRNRENGRLLIVDSMVDDQYSVSADGEVLAINVTPDTFRKTLAAYAGIARLLGDHRNIPRRRQPGPC